jgi:hypothetical protein
MQIITFVLQTGLLIWFGLLSLLIATRVLRGDIKAIGVLEHSARSEAVAPERVVSMAVFPIIIVGYAVVGLHADVSGPNPSLPEIPNEIVNLLIGSNGLYLAGKIARG